ncbi:MAG TPA: hypothetical protein VFT72_08330 [Opitutaceae bacterium]|nr:hypothetical protein [Opitutaceae bacterium]
MRTVVYQSFRTRDVPSWIQACLDSVRGWADAQGFEYTFYDDRFFDLVPRELYPRASAHKCILADYARLVAAKNLLAEGYDRAIWLDADALVFAPEKLTLPLSHGYAFCREVWLDRVVFGRPQFKLTVNNAMSVFCSDQTIIDFYLHAADEILRSSKPLAPVSIGTEFLLKLRRAHPFPLVTNVGILGPEMAYRYLQNEGSFLRPYLDFQTSAVYAANLCLSHQSGGPAFKGAPAGWKLDEPTLLGLIRRLQQDEGASLNQWFSGSYVAPADEFDRPISRYIGMRHALRDVARAARKS